MIKAPFKTVIHHVLPTVATIAIAGALLAIYAGFTAGKAVLTSTVYSLLLTVAIRIYRFIHRFTAGMLSKALLFLLLQTATVAVTFLIILIPEPAALKQLAFAVPLLLIFGSLILCICAVPNQFAGSEHDDEHGETAACPPDVKNVAGLQQSVELERISVKHGSEIHILKTVEIYYVESYGDYVFIHSESEKYIKEQTMRWFEANLPSNFVRIHRSYIVNTDYIIRLELFDRENYYVRIKNGVRLKASKTGFRLLKENLNL